MTNQQNITKLFLTGSDQGTPIPIDATAKATPTTIHVTEEGDLDYLHCMFVKLTNLSGARVSVSVFWNPDTDSDAGMTAIELVYELPPKGDAWIAEGDPIGGTHFAAGNARAGISAIVGSGDTGKVRAMGWANRLEQPGD